MADTFSAPNVEPNPASSVLINLLFFGGIILTFVVLVETAGWAVALILYSWGFFGFVGVFFFWMTFETHRRKKLVAQATSERAAYEIMHEPGKHGISVLAVTLLTGLGGLLSVRIFGFDNAVSWSAALLLVVTLISVVVGYVWSEVSSAETKKHVEELTIERRETVREEVKHGPERKGALANRRPGPSDGEKHGDLE